MHDLHDLLRTGDRFEDTFAHRALANGRDELAHDPEIHIGFEESDTNVTERLVEIGLGHTRTASKALEGVGQPVRKLLEHHTTLGCRGTNP